MGAMPENAVTLVRKTDGVKEVGTAGIDSAAPVDVRTMSIWKMVAVRVVRTYLSTFLGLLTVDSSGVATITIGGADSGWGALSSAALVALAPSFVSLLHNTVDFLTKLDVTNPEWRA